MVELYLKNPIIKVKQIYGDTQLVIRQLMGEYEVRKSELISDHVYAEKLLQSLCLVSIKQVTRKMNKQADALAGLASSLAFLGKEIRVLVGEK
ncbi:hypothetical protein LIER_44033 [Lithospermum erythrorhizon]|uniref:RNase H type-1 domain-containing protein n=1 Tax=Lithospermum erythrorhizon TaxID=34254 RepID=A0AAV3RQE3_LITER